MTHSVGAAVPESEPRSIDDLGVETWSPEELEEEIAELCAHIDAATYRLLRAIGELDRREAWATGFESVAHWLSWRVGIDLVTARQKVRVARALENLPLISDAFRQGKVSYSKVRAMTRVATPDNEAYLLYIAQNGTACDVERLVRAYRRSSKGEDLEEARRHREERYLEMYTDDDGMVVIRGRLPQELAALLEKALEAAMDALNEEEKASEEENDAVILAPHDPAESPTRSNAPAKTTVPESSTLSVIPAEAGISKQHVSRHLPHDPVESRSGSAVPAEVEIPQHHIDLHLPKSFRAPRTQPVARPAYDSAGSGGPSLSVTPHDPAESRRLAVIPGQEGIQEPREDVAQRRVDALALLAEAALGQGLARTVRGEPYQVMIHVESAVLAGTATDGLCELEGGDGISAESCRRLTCDAPHVTVEKGAEGNLLHIGRKARKISTPLWRALVSRDRTCKFPGCSKTRHLQAHHVEHWAKGGETTPENLLLLCRAHHWAVHECGFRVEGRAPGEFVFWRPDGSPLPVCPVQTRINGRAGETLKKANRDHGLDITSETIDGLWDGEVMDIHMAVDGLLDCEDIPDEEQ